MTRRWCGAFLCLLPALAALVRPAARADRVPTTVFVDLDRLLAAPLSPAVSPRQRWPDLSSLPEVRPIDGDAVRQASPELPDLEHTIESARLEVELQQQRRSLQQEALPVERARWQELGEDIARSREEWSQARRRAVVAWSLQEQAMLLEAGQTGTRAALQLIAPRLVPVAQEQISAGQSAAASRRRLEAAHSRQERWERRWLLLDAQHGEREHQLQQSRQLDDLNGLLEEQEPLPGYGSPKSVAVIDELAARPPWELLWWEATSAPQAPAAPGSMPLSPRLQKRRDDLRRWVKSWAAARGWQVVFEPRSGIPDRTDLFLQALQQGPAPAAGKDTSL